MLVSLSGCPTGRYRACVQRRGMLGRCPQRCTAGCTDCSTAIQTAANKTRQARAGFAESSKPGKLFLTQVLRVAMSRSLRVAVPSDRSCPFICGKSLNYRSLLTYLAMGKSIVSDARRERSLPSHARPILCYIMLHSMWNIVFSGCHHAAISAAG